LDFISVPKITGGDFMVFSISEIISLVLATLVLVKLIGITVNQKGWMNFAKGFMGNSALFSVVGVLISGVSLFFLLKELSIVQIYASMAVFSGLVMLSFAAFPDLIGPLVTKIAKKKNILRKAWLASSLWIAFTIWVLYTIFA